MSQYLMCLKEAHDRFLAFVFEGYRFKKMEQNPLHSKELGYGVPQLFNEIIDGLLEDTHQVHAEEFLQMSKTSANPRAKFIKPILMDTKSSQNSRGGSPHHNYETIQDYEEQIQNYKSMTNNKNTTAASMKKKNLKL